MKLVKDMMLVIAGATTAILVEKYGGEMLEMASDMMSCTNKCTCNKHRCN